ncbi:hypothetical protein P4O66_001340 [Electrophorus voltai]|uniref:Integrase catalytic domain-containing protein n=1 Tax=Electrophorus voltai TaxID=2609070 RepID=A0AAD8Z853_9TELE|nr:hypothetical protein P4O66_001340 [Electrophorus voltai]
MNQEIIRYVASCAICTCSKTPRTPPAGKLLSLPTPPQPWSHLAIDFVTGLPVSEGNTIVLVVVDRFSKMVRFLPLRTNPLPGNWQNCSSTMSSGCLDCQNIVSDRGPQFMSKVWKELLEKLNISQPDIWLPPSGQWAGRKGKPGTGKLATRYEGPYTVTRCINEVTYHIGLPRNSQASRAFHVSALNPVVEGPLSEESNPSAYE